MDRSTTKFPVLITLTFGLALAVANGAIAASKLGSLAVAPSTNSAELLDVATLEDLVARIALYPDELLAVVLPASTFPLQIVQAARYLEAHKSDATLEPNSGWDESIIALLNYPEVITLLNTDLDWTWQLGEAVIKQQADVIVAVEHFREHAYAAGNLKSDEHKVVKRDHGAVAITSADRDAVYVPYYEPAEVVYQQSVTPYYYYPTRYPLYYYPYSPGHAFHSSAFWGITTAFTIGWFTNHLHFHPYGYRSHPFYGHRYHRSIFRHHGLHSGRRHLNSRHRNQRNYHGDYWNANNRSHHRPRHLRHARGHNNQAFGGQRGLSDAPLRASNGLLGNGTNGRRSLANRGNGLRGPQQRQATATLRAGNGLIGNGVGNRRGLPNRSNSVQSVQRTTASTNPRASNGVNRNRTARANSTRTGASARANRGGSRPATRSQQRRGADRSQATTPMRSTVAARGPGSAALINNAARRSPRPAAQPRATARSGNRSTLLANNNFAGPGGRTGAVDFNAPRRASKARSSNRAASAPRSNAQRGNRSSSQARSNRSSGNTNRGAGNRSGRGSRAGGPGFGRSALRAIRTRFNRATPSISSATPRIRHAHRALTRV